MLTISLPLTAKQATAVTVAADRLGVKPWEMAVHILALKQELEFERRHAQSRPQQ